MYVKYALYWWSLYKCVRERFIIYIVPGLYLVLFSKKQEDVSPSSKNIKLLLSKYIGFCTFKFETSYFMGMGWCAKWNVAIIVKVCDILCMAQAVISIPICIQLKNPSSVMYSSTLLGTNPMSLAICFRWNQLL